MGLLSQQGAVSHCPPEHKGREPLALLWGPGRQRAGAAPGVCLCRSQTLPVLVEEFWEGDDDRLMKPIKQ